QLTGATAIVLFSSIATGLNEEFSNAILCAGGYDLTIRSSFLLKRFGAGSALSGCSNATISNTHDDSVDTATAQSWFAGWPGNLRLTAAGKDQFDGVALWQPGDPTTDIDGQPRPTTEGPDVAGAHR